MTHLDGFGRFLERKEEGIAVKRSILTALIAFFLVAAASTVYADKAGKVIGDSMYVDNTFGFTMQIPDRWKFQEINDDDDIERLVLLQKSPVIPARFDRQRESFFTQPQVTVLAAKKEEIDYAKEMRPKEYADFLMSDDGDDDLKDKAHGSFLLLRMESEYTFRPRRTRSIFLGGERGAQITGRKQYYYAFEGGETLSDFVTGHISILETDDAVILIECVSEREMEDNVEDDFDFILDSVGFPEEKSGGEKSKDKGNKEKDEG